MTVQTHGGLMVIGCGDFGAAAVNHLQERGVESASVGGRRVALVTLAGKAATRQQAASMFEAATQGGWEELEEALRLCGSQPLIALIGAADDTAGGGLLVSALRYLTEGNYGRTAVWLAVPDGVRRYQARAYATLTELEVLRKNGALERCFLREIASGSVAYAGMFGEAAVAYAQGKRGAGMDAGFGFGGGMYAGFGLGAVRDVAGLLTEQAAVLKAKAVVQQRTVARGDQPGGFSEVLMSAADELLRDEIPDTWLEQRWMVANRPHLARTCLNQDYTGEPLADFLDRHMAFQDRSYRDNRTWVVERVRALKHAVLTQIRDLRDKCGQDSEAACDELFEALAALKDAVDRGIARHMKSQQSLLHEYETLRQQLAHEIVGIRGRGILPRRIGDGQRQAFLQTFEEIDVSGSACLVAGLRFQELRQVLIELEREQTAMAATLDAVREREDTLTRLRDEVEGWAVATETGPLALHVHPPAPGAEAVRRLVDAVEPAPLLAALQQSSTRAPSAQALALRLAAETAARIALDGMPELLSARGDASRERWLTSVKPSLELADPLPSGTKPPARTCRMTDNVPAQLRVDLDQQLAVTPGSFPGKWFQGDALVYSETDGVELSCLKALPELHAAYTAQLGQQQGLHVLPEPDGGWPKLLPETRVPREQLEEAATTVVRACLLGLIGPSAESTLTARYLQQDHQAIQSVSWPNLGEAVRGVAMRKPLQDGLGSQVARWLSSLQEPQVAGYYALLAQFQHSPAVARLKGDDAGVVTKAIAAEMAEAVRMLQERGDSWEPRARAMAEQVGGSEDGFSLAAGEWRYLKW